jgi:hypothetical protein
MDMKAKKVKQPTTVKPVTPLSLGLIKEAARKNPTARLVFKAMASRDRELRAPKYEIELARLKHDLDQEHNITNKNFYQVFKDLQDAGVGIMIMGRRGNPLRFKWFYSIKSVGQCGRGQMDNVVPIGSKAPKDPEIARSIARLEAQRKDFVEPHLVMADPAPELPLPAATSQAPVIHAEIGGEKGKLTLHTHTGQPMTLEGSKAFLLDILTAAIGTKSA